MKFIISIISIIFLLSACNGSTELEKTLEFSPEELNGKWISNVYAKYPDNSIKKLSLSADRVNLAFTDTSITISDEKLIGSYNYFGYWEDNVFYSNDNKKCEVIELDSLWSELDLRGVYKPSLNIDSIDVVGFALYKDSN